MICPLYPDPQFFIFTSEIPPLIYYSHLSVLILLFISIYIYAKNKTLTSKMLLYFSLIFSIWTFLDLITWTNNKSGVIIFAWSLLPLLYSLLMFGCLYLTYVFIEKKDISSKIKYFSLFLFLPAILITPTIYNLTGFNLNLCGCAGFEGGFFIYYKLILGLIIFFWILLLSINKYRRSVNESKKEILIFSIGIELFVTTLFISEFIASYMVKIGLAFDFRFTQYSFIAMSLFVAFLTYLIVRFKAFNIKLLGAQALVWALVILVGAQFLYLKDVDLYVKVLTGITLTISGILGLVLVRSVKKEDALNEQLAVANAGQTNLIHIMNHQIKGYLSVSKNIFAELLTDDYGKVPEEAKDIISQGLENADKGAKYVAAILKGESAENGKLSYDMQKIDFKKLVSEVAAKEKEMVEKKGLKFGFEVGPGDYNITGDSTHLGEAVRNLIDNSLNYTPSGSIEVRLSTNGKTVLLKVKDTGVGVKEEDKSKLFKAGGVGSDSIKINTNSSGYGLAFVKGAIEKHNGKVWFESAGAGCGSTFFIELPIK